MGRRSGSVRNVPRNMLFNLIGKLILRFVAQGNINATVERFSPGIKLMKEAFIFSFIAL